MYRIKNAHQLGSGAGTRNVLGAAAGTGFVRASVSGLLQQYLPSAFCQLLAKVWVSLFPFRSICAS